MGPVRVSGVAPDAVAPTRRIQDACRRPGQRLRSAELAQTSSHQSEVALEGRRDPGVRTAGNQPRQPDGRRPAGLRARTTPRRSASCHPTSLSRTAAASGTTRLIPAGPLTELDTFSIAPFPNFVSVVPDVPRAQFKEIVENARVADSGGRRPVRTDRRVPASPTTPTRTGAGRRQRRHGPDAWAAGCARWSSTTARSWSQDGAVVAGPGVAIATNDFSARGGDQYPFRGLPFTTVGVCLPAGAAQLHRRRSRRPGDLGGRLPGGWGGADHATRVIADLRVGPGSDPEIRRAGGRESHGLDVASMYGRLRLADFARLSRWHRSHGAGRAAQGEPRRCAGGRCLGRLVRDLGRRARRPAVGGWRVRRRLRDVAGLLAARLVGRGCAGACDGAFRREWPDERARWKGAARERGQARDR